MVIYDTNGVWPSYPFTLTNILTNGSFDTAGTWTAGYNITVTQNTDPAYIMQGSGSLKLTSSSTNEALYYNTAAIPQIQNHIYYGCLHVYDTNVATYMQIYWPEAEPSMGVTAAKTPLNTWHRHSLRLVRSSWSTGNQRFRFDYEGAAGRTSYVDAAMLIDLTAAFGAGKEPSLSWCDENIPYFEDTLIVEETSKYIQVNQKPKEISQIYRLENGFWNPINNSSVVLNKINDNILKVNNNFTNIFDTIVLPEEYQFLEYIMGNSVPYIMTDVIPNGNTKVIANIYFDAASPSNMAVFGSRQSNSSNTFVFWQINSSTFRSDYATTQASISVTTKGHYNIRKEMNTTHISPTLVGGSSGLVNFTSPVPMTIFTINTNGTLASNKLVGRVYSFDIYDKYTLMRKMIPVKKVSNGICGLYDIITKTFYPSSGAVNFIGKEFISLPSDYIELESITSTGTQFIDTGYIPDYTTKVEVDCIFPCTSSGSYYLFGARESSYVDNYSFQTTTGVYYSKYGTADKSFGSSFANRMIIQKNGKYVSANETMTATNVDCNFTCKRNMYIFGCNSAGTLYGGCPVTLYRCKIWDKGTTLIRDYIPVQQKSTNTVGLYDLIEGQFYPNAGTGTFTFVEKK